MYVFLLKPLWCSDSSVEANVRIQDDFSNFFDSHFSDDAVKAFHCQFFNPSGDALQHVQFENYEDSQSEEDRGEEKYEEDDGLGYYPDGVKRTLTDEQIEIFRHSELHALEREKEREEERRSLAQRTPSGGAHSVNREGSGEDVEGAENAEEGEVQCEEQDQARAPAVNKKKRKRKGKNGNGNGKYREPKPDLRKRTWDVVETGLDSLDYD